MTSFPLPDEESQILLISDCVAMLLFSEEKIWLCVGEVNDLKFDGQSVSYLNLDMLAKHTVTVSYQVLGLRPATVDDDPDGQHDWQTYHIANEYSFTVPGRLVQPINPKVSTTHTNLPWYLFQGTFLVALAASMFQQTSIATLKSVPKVVPNKEYPYRESSGE